MASTANVLPTQLPRFALKQALLMRLCATSYSASEPGFRASASYRFDDPIKGFETLYCAPDFGTCYFETVVRDTKLDPITKRMLVPRQMHDSKSLSLVLVDLTHLMLVDLFNTIGLQHLGLNLSQVTDSDYKATQTLAADLYGHADAPHGLVYRSRFNPDLPAVVLFDRAKSAVRLFPGTPPMQLNAIPELFDGLTAVPVPIALV